MKTDNNNQNFLNSLDDWGSILTDTYEKYTNTTLYDTKNNIKLRLDDTKPTVEADSDQYYETYEVNNIKLVLSLYTFKNEFNEIEHIYFKLDLYRNSNQINLVNIIYITNKNAKDRKYLYVQTKSSAGAISIKHNLSSAEAILIKHNFLNKYLTNGKEHITVDDTVYEEFTQAVLSTYKNCEW